MIRMSVSLPEVLKERMDQFGAFFNWSHQARIAFARAIQDFVDKSAKQEKTKIQQVVERLRASRVEASSEQRTDGHTVGVYWAQNKASASELERLASYRDSAGPSWEQGLTGTHTAYGPGEHFNMAIASVSPDAWDRSDAVDFWEEVLGDDEYEARANDADFVIGFAMGALSVWDEVSDQL